MRRLKYVGYRLAQWVSLHVPPSQRLAWAERAADFQWRRARTVRNAVSGNLSLLLGTTVGPDDPRVREVFRNFGRYLVEWFTLHEIPQPRVSVEGYAHLLDARRDHQGVIVLTAHLGNWEVGAACLQRFGVRFTALALPYETAAMDRLFNAQRRRCGIHVIALGRHAARQALERLRAGDLVGILGDRDFSDQGVSVRFCGRSARIPKGPAVLSLRARVPILPCFLIREAPWQFRLFIEPPMWPGRSGGGVEASVHELTQAYAGVVERYLTRYPAQWLMFDPFQTTGLLEQHERTVLHHSSRV